MSFIAAVVAAAKSVAAAGGVLKNFTGSTPKDFQKFNRAVGPVMMAKAQVTGVSTYALWFGDVVKIDGSTLNFNVIGSPGDLDTAEIVFRQEAERLGQIFVFRCQVATDLNSIDSLNRTCYFQDTRGAGFVGLPAFPPPGARPPVLAGGFGSLSNVQQAVLAGGILLVGLMLFGRR